MFLPFFTAMQRRFSFCLIFAFHFVVLIGIEPAHAAPLFQLTGNGSEIYYSPGERQIARRLAAAAPRICQFLEEYGLSVKKPVHVILDENLDTPGPQVHVIPHREIRLGLKAPGVFEDGWLEADPWRYYLFKGLCLQAIYGMRSGIPALVHKGFGEIVSPNVILPDWITDGVCHLLYSRYNHQPTPTPIYDAILQNTPIADLDAVSNHPEIWPGHHSYRIFGRPFIQWVVDRHGWDGLLGFLSEHGGGVIPFEIDWKAERITGYTWPQLWRQFQQSLPGPGQASSGDPVHGYWANPYLFWNRAGIFPGVERIGRRGRYGYLDEKGSLWLSQYDQHGISKRIRYRGDQPVWMDEEHFWDPGPGGVAVTRIGHRPCLAVLPREKTTQYEAINLWSGIHFDTIVAPEGILQLSGPVMDADGRIAVAGNRMGNWDIWLYDGDWQRVTDSPAAEIDPWFEKNTILFASNRDGSFRIMDTGGTIRSRCDTQAVMPRDDKFLCLSGEGWVPTILSPAKRTAEKGPDFTEDTIQGADAKSYSPSVEEERKKMDGQSDERYNPFSSLFPNYLQPELFISETDLQVGVGTFGRDVSGDYTVDGGVRYAADDEFWSIRAGASAKRFGLRYTRYPFSYSTALGQSVDESRHEIKSFWRPWEYEEVEVSFNYRIYQDRDADQQYDEEQWAALHVAKEYGRHRGWLNLEWFSGDRRSIFGGGQLFFGESVFTMLHLQAGKSWGPILPGHDTYRIGGNVLEGYFTQRPSRLFPLRGFDSNILDADQAITSGIEVFFPLVNFQAGYMTLPLFFHRMMLGTFVDAGAADDSIDDEDILVGAGVEIVTSMEIAWGYLSSFHMGVAWPIRQPDVLDESGPVFLIQLGTPL